MHLHFLVLLLCALYGSVFTIGKVALDYTSPLFLTGSRMVLAAALLFAYQLCFNRKDIKIQKRHLLPIFIVALTNVYLTNFFEFWGLQFMESSKACFLYSFSPIATALLSYFWFSEKITPLKWLGLTIGLLGFLPILIVTPGKADTSLQFGFLSLAELALLAAAVTTSIGWMAMRVLVKHHNCSSVMANSTTMFLGGVFALIHSLCIDSWNPVPISDFSAFLPLFLGLTLVSNLLGYNLNAFLLRHYTATYISFAGLSQPVFAAFFGFIFLGEVMSGYFWISFAAVSVGLFIYYREELKQGLVPTHHRHNKSSSTKPPSSHQNNMSAHLDVSNP